MADSWTTPDHETEAATQAEIASQLPDAQAPDVAGETADQPDAAAFQEDTEPVKIVLSADATTVGADGEEVPVNEVAIAGVVLKPGEPVEVDPSVARGIVSSEDNVEVAD